MSQGENIATERSSQVVILLIAVFGIIWGLLTKFAEKYVFASISGGDLIAPLVSALITLLILRLNEERIVEWALQRISSFHKGPEKPHLGDWVINISHIDSTTMTPCLRVGAVQIVPSLAGPVLKGGQLMDKETKKVVVEKWVSVHAEFISERDALTLFYFYKIWRPDNSAACDKVGYVIARKTVKDGVYEGHFADISVAGHAGEVERQGTVQLFKVANGN
jgi:hypothetical protein